MHKNIPQSGKTVLVYGIHYTLVSFSLCFIFKCYVDMKNAVYNFLFSISFVLIKNGISCERVDCNKVNKTKSEGGKTVLLLGLKT